MGGLRILPGQTLSFLCSLSQPSWYPSISGCTPCSARRTCKLYLVRASIRHPSSAPASRSQRGGPCSCLYRTKLTPAPPRPRSACAHLPDMRFTLPFSLNPPAAGRGRTRRQFLVASVPLFSFFLFFSFRTHAGCKDVRDVVRISSTGCGSAEGPT